MIKLTILFIGTLLVLIPIKGICQCADPSTMDTVVTAAFDCSSYTWNVSGITYTESATDTIISDTCTMHVLNFTKKGKIVKGFSVTTCGNYVWDSTGIAYTASGLYTHQTVTSEGCIVESQLNLIIDPDLAPSTESTVCSNLKWYELGLPLGSETAASVELSESGKIVALGYPQINGGEVKVYEFDGDQWMQKGSTLYTSIANANFGIDVSLSADGSILAVGANKANGDAGQVKVFGWDGTDWQLMGKPINGFDASDFFGESLDLNNDGTILAVGAPRSNRVAVSLGEVRIYHWNGNDWAVMGNYIARYLYLNSPNQNGTSVALSADGMKVIFGSPYSKVILRTGNPGEFSVYYWDGTKWKSERNGGGVQHQDRMGFSVDMNDDATVLAGGADGVNSDMGKVIGQFTVDGQSLGERFGHSVSLDQEGKTLAVSGDQNSDEGSYRGVVRVYRKDESDSPYQVGQSLYGEVDGQYFGNSVSLNGNGNILAVGSKYAGLGGTKLFYLACDTSITKCVPPLTGTDVITACKSYTWIDGITYTASNNTAAFTLQNGAGVDSIVTLDLTINTVNKETSLNGSVISSNASGATYQWLDCNNAMSSINGETGQSFTASGNGNYAVEVTENGCVDTSSCVAVTPLGLIQNSLNHEFVLYPNPTNGQFKIQFYESQNNITVKLFSVTGKLIETKRIDGSKEIDFQMTQPDGVYMVEILDETNGKAVLKVIKR